MSKLIRPDEFYSSMRRDEIRIPEDEQTVLEKHAETIRSIQHRTRKTLSEAVLKMGSELAAAQAQLAKHGDGTFGKWVRDRCGISPRSAYRAIAAHKTFGVCASLAQTSFEPLALYLLSADSTPQAATDQALTLANKGELITAKKAREIIRQHTDQDDEDDQVEDGEVEDDQVSPGWDAGTCLTEMRREVLKWRKVCKPEELPQLAQLLEHFATQVKAAHEKSQSIGQTQE